MRIIYPKYYKKYYLISRSTMKWMIVVPLFLLLLIPAYVWGENSDEYQWSDYREPLERYIKVCHNRSAVITVNLPKDFIQNHKEIILIIDVESETSLTSDRRKSSFNIFKPFIKVNGASIFGSKYVPVKDLPARQTQQIILNNKYLKPGINTLGAIFRWNSTSSYCMDSCCGYKIHKMYFKDAPLPPLPLTYALDVTSNPSGAMVLLNGTYRGLTPIKITDLKEDKYSINLSKDGYETLDDNVELNKDKSLSFTMKSKLGTSAAGPNDSLQAMLAIVEKKEAEAQRQAEIARLKEEAEKKRRAEIENDIATYEKIVNSPYGKDMAAQAWQSLVNKYPEAKEVPAGNVSRLKFILISGKISETEPMSGMELVFVKGDCFQMGDTFGGGDADEKPVHEVCLDDFYISKYEVTQGQWKTIMGKNPSYNVKYCGDNCPVELVNWNDVQEFIRRLNQKTGKNYRLPTEAEWEYAARSGGKNEKWAGTSNTSEVGEYAWYDKNSNDKTHPVGQKKPNNLGIYDMSGNVWEWVSDWYGENYYNKSPRDNPQGPANGVRRVVRGGSWDVNYEDPRCANRFRNDPGFRLLNYGFRVARSAQ